MRQIVRSFSIGLFAAGIIMLAVYFLSDGKNSAESLELEELIPLVEEKGHRVVTEEDYIILSVQSSEKPSKEEVTETEGTTEQEDNATETENSDNNEESTDKEEENKSETEPEQNKPVEFKLQIKSGMPSAEIGNLLEQNKVIDNAKEFTDYLEEHDFSGKLKAGTHHVSSDMSYYELAMELISP